MGRLSLFSLFWLLAATAFADNSAMLAMLDSVIEKRPEMIQAKEDGIEFLKKKLKNEKEGVVFLNGLDELYNEYYVFKFDSAMVYAKKGLKWAKQLHNVHYENLFRIHLAEIFAIGGLYSEAVNTLDSISYASIEPELLFKYYYSYFLAYSYWSDYCSDQDFTPAYRQKASHNLDLAMKYADKTDPLIQFFLGEQRVYVDHDSREARTFYLNVLNTTPEESRIYAMASFALAGNYMMDGDNDKYEEYLIKAALSDLKGCTMENLALQNLAVFLFQQGEGQMERAVRYINLSMEDAMFYNNKLRMIEISKFLPNIMSTYQRTVKQHNRNLKWSVAFISLLLIGLLFTMYFNFKQNRKLSARRKALSDSNSQLANLNSQLAESNLQQVELNKQLQQLNKKLVDTNVHRERLASIYIDLCARYIDKLGKYQTLVKRKIKANQAQELLQTISSTRISEEDAATFLNRFDKAFLELYPTFVDEFNALLVEDERIKVKSAHNLTTELRTFALIRLGVKNTADIAGLLFLSPQTIYNCRSVTKNKAIRKDTFDADVLKLCTVIQPSAQLPA